MSLKRFGALLGIATASLALLAGGVRGGAALDARYAKTYEVAQLSDKLDRLALDIRIGQLEARLESLRAERFQRALAAKRGRVPDEELARLDALNAQIETLQRMLDGLYTRRERGG